MRLNKVLLLTVLIGMIPYTAGCISRGEFDELTQELEMARSDFEKLQTEHEALNKQYEEALANLASAESQIYDLRTTLLETSMGATDQQAVIPIVRVVFAAQDIPAGTIIERDMIVEIPYLADLLVETMVTDLEVVVGRGAKIDISRGIVITQSLFSED